MASFAVLLNVYTENELEKVGARRKNIGYGGYSANGNKNMKK